MYGTQAAYIKSTGALVFENDVKMYGTQASQRLSSAIFLFENDVKMYGTQAFLATCNNIC